MYFLELKAWPNWDQQKPILLTGFMATKTTVLLENLLMTWKVTALVFLPVISGPKNGWFLSQKSKLIARLSPPSVFQS